MYIDIWLKAYIIRYTQKRKYRKGRYHMETILSGVFAELRKVKLSDGSPVYHVGIKNFNCVLQCVDYNHAMSLYKSIEKCIGIDISVS